MTAVERQRKWRRRHLTAVREANRKWIARWRKIHPILAKRQQRLDNARYSLHHPDVRAACKRRYRQRHPEVHVADEARRRARRAATGGSFTAAEWLGLKRYYGFRCISCGRSERTLMRLGLKLVPDHVVPLALGGTNMLGNLQPLCHGVGGCNNRKHAKFIDYRR